MSRVQTILAPAALWEANSYANTTGKRRSQDKQAQQNCRRLPGKGGSASPFLPIAVPGSSAGAHLGTPAESFLPTPAPQLSRSPPGSLETWKRVSPPPLSQPEVPPGSPHASPAGGGTRPGHPDWSDCGRSRTLLRTLLGFQKRQFQYWGGTNRDSTADWSTSEVAYWTSTIGMGRAPGGRVPIGQVGGGRTRRVRLRHFRESVPGAAPMKQNSAEGCPPGLG